MSSSTTTQLKWTCCLEIVSIHGGNCAPPPFNNFHLVSNISTCQDVIGNSWSQYCLWYQALPPPWPSHVMEPDIVGPCIMTYIWANKAYKYVICLLYRLKVLCQGCQKTSFSNLIYTCAETNFASDESDARETSYFIFDEEAPLT